MGTSTEDGISLLLRAMSADNIAPSADLAAAEDRLRNGGEQAADALASLIRDLVDSRSPHTATALVVSKACVMTPALKDAAKAVAEAPELRPGHPGTTRFSPEIFGEGKVGWASGTAARTRDLAQQVLGVPPTPLPSVAADAPDTAALVTRIRDFVAGQEHSTRVTEAGGRAGPAAAGALKQLIEQNRSGPMALAVVYAVKDWSPPDALPFIRHALGTGYPGAEYYAGIYVGAHPTPEIKALARECLAKVRDDDARRSLRDVQNK